MVMDEKTQIYEQEEQSVFRRSGAVGAQEDGAEKVSPARLSSPVGLEGDQ
jgi:hypothetical protein